jgi:hypothetical protein
LSPNKSRPSFVVRPLQESKCVGATLDNEIGGTAEGIQIQTERSQAIGKWAGSESEGDSESQHYT